MAKTPERKVWTENYSDWFHKILSEVPVYDTRYPVKGTGIWTPFGFKLRKGVIEIIRDELEKANHEEVLFPLLIPDYMLGKEGDHIKKFDDEVYWVTHGGRDLLDVKLALRPTSETAIYPMFQLWVNAYSDLPIRIFQIVNIFRYETKATRPMIRVREVSTFKEAHTAHATREDAENQVRDGIAIYSKIFERLRIPFFKSIRPEWDKFPGAEYSVAFDIILPDGKVLQIGTVHFLGQGFAKAFDIKYMTTNGGYEYIWQTCYGISERAIAALISTHGDDNGMNLPSNVAPIQAVIIPIVYKGKEEDVLKKCNEVKGILTSAGIRTAVDDRKEITPGNKYFAWELKGTPVRIELGPRDIEAATAVLVRRDLLQKTVVPISAITEETRKLLASVDEALGERSKKWMAERLTKVTSLDVLQKTLDTKGGIVEVPWCGERGCGEEMEAKMNARILGTPYHDEMVVECSQSCVFCGKDATKAIRVARSY